MDGFFMLAWMRPGTLAQIAAEQTQDFVKSGDVTQETIANMALNALIDIEGEEKAMEMYEKAMGFEDED